MKHPSPVTGQRNSAPNSQQKPLFWLLVGGVLVRVLLLLWFEGRAIHDDEHDYDRLAVSLVDRGEFAFRPGVPASLRPPLYPAGVAAIYWSFGHGSHQAVRAAQAVLSVINMLLMYRFGSAVFAHRTAIWLSAFYCFYPSLLGFNNLILTEVLFTFLLCAGCSLVVRSFVCNSVVWLGAGGIVLGLACLSRSVLWLFPPVAVVFLLAAWRGTLATRAIAVGAFLVGFCAPLAPWAVRNTRLEKTFTTVDTMGGRNFMMGNYEYTPLFRAWDAISHRGEKAWDQVLVASEPSFKMMTQGQKDKVALRAGIRFVLANPILTLKRDTIKFFQFWGLERELIAGAGRGYFGDLPVAAIILLTVLIFGSYTMAMISGVFGAVMVPPADRRVHWFLLLVIAFICGVHTLVFAHSRYHLPMMPLVLMYSANALTHLREIWQRRGEWSFWLAVGLSGVLAAGWMAEIIFVEYDQYAKMIRSLM